MNLDGLPPVGGLIESSLTAWEGRTAAVVFLQGCNLACPACPVPHLVPRQGASADRGDDGVPKGRIPVESVLDAVFTRRHLLDGVVISGGEALLHESLPDLVEILRSFGLAVRIRTNGTRPSKLERLLELNLLDGVTLVLRAPLDAIHAVAVGREVDRALVFRTIETLIETPGDHEVRLIVDPRILTGEDVDSVARTVAGIERLVLEPVREGQPGPRILQALARKVGTFARTCFVAGRPDRDFGSAASSRTGRGRRRGDDDDGQSLGAA